MEGDHLKILGVQESDSGQYTCQATNTAGTAQDHIILRVGAAPSVIQVPEGECVMAAAWPGITGGGRLKILLCKQKAAINAVLAGT